MLTSMSIAEIVAMMPDLVAKSYESELVTDLIKAEPEIMKVAAQKALIAQEHVAMEAQTASAKKKAHVGARYIDCGGTLLEPLVEQKEIKIVDARYLITLAQAGGVAPLWRDVPDCARIKPSNLWRLRSWNAAFSLPVLVISSPRHGQHPDRYGKMLRRILPILLAFQKKATLFGKHAAVGVLWEFMSVPQGVDRNETRCVVNEWYAHPFTPVLLLDPTRPTATFDAGTHAPRLETRSASCGWCAAERRIASLCKEDRLLWSASSEELDELNDDNDNSKVTFDHCCILLRDGPNKRVEEGPSPRDPIASPERLKRELAEGFASGALIFDSRSDVEVASDFYARGFTKAFEMFSQAGGRAILYNGLGWGSKEAPILAEALEYLHEHCASTDKPPVVNFEENRFGTEDKKMLSLATHDESKLSVLV